MTNIDLVTFFTHTSLQTRVNWEKGLCMQVAWGFCGRCGFPLFQPICLFNGTSGHIYRKIYVNPRESLYWDLWIKETACKDYDIPKVPNHKKYRFTSKYIGYIFICLILCSNPKVEAIFSSALCYSSAELLSSREHTSSVRKTCFFRTCQED